MALHRRQPPQVQHGRARRRGLAGVQVGAGRRRPPAGRVAPLLVQGLARRLEEHFGHPRGFLNSPMATYYYDCKHQYLKNHQEKAHNCESTGQIKSAAPIYNLSLGAPRNFVIADLNSLGKFKRADMHNYADIRMNSGPVMMQLVLRGLAPRRG